MAERAPLSAPIEALRAIAEAIGLDPSKHRVVSIDVHASAREMPRIAVTMLMDIEGRGRLCEIVKRYQLVEQEADGDAPSDLIADAAPLSKVNFREFT